MDKQLTFLMVWAYFSASAYACGPQPGRPGNNPGGFYPDSVASYDSLQTILGGSIRIDGSIKQDSDGDINNAQDLQCRVWDRSCRWRNLKGGVLDWHSGSGTPDGFRLQAASGTFTPPQPPFAIVAINKALPSSESGGLASDRIPCQSGDSEVRFRYWTSPQVRLMACWRKIGSQAFDFCSPPITDGDPGPAIIRLPGVINVPFEIVVNADNFVYDDGRHRGGFAIIDDLEYIAQPCVRAASNQVSEVDLGSNKAAFLGSPPGLEPLEDRTEASVRNPFQLTDLEKANAVGNSIDNVDIEACEKVRCNFREGSCLGYLLQSDFNVHHGPVGNPVTGIRGDGSSAPFNETGEFAYAVGPRDAARFTLPSFTLSQPRRLQFAYYVAAVDSRLRVSTTQNGQPDVVIFDSPVADINSRRWVFESRPLQPGRYEKVTFEAINLKANTFVGLDEIKLVDTNDSQLC